MANELTLSASMSFAKTNFATLLRNFSSLLRDVSGSPMPALRTQMVGITEEALYVGDIVTLGYCLMKNCDSVNYITVRPGTGTADLIKLKAGDIALFRFAMNTPYVVANTGGCILEYYLIPD